MLFPEASFYAIYALITPYPFLLKVLKEDRGVGEGENFSLKSFPFPPRLNIQITSQNTAYKARCRCRLWR